MKVLYCCLLFFSFAEPALPAEVAPKQGGYLQFNHEELAVIMPQVARNYHMQLIWKDTSIRHLTFAMKFSRAKPLKELVRVFNFSHKVKISISGDQLIMDR